jgi:hypothetical protein
MSKGDATMPKVAYKHGCNWRLFQYQVLTSSNEEVERTLQYSFDCLITHYCVSGIVKLIYSHCQPIFMLFRHSSVLIIQFSVPLLVINALPVPRMCLLIDPHAQEDATRWWVGIRPWQMSYISWRVHHTLHETIASNNQCSVYQFIMMADVALSTLRAIFTNRTCQLGILNPKDDTAKSLSP